MFDFLKKKKKEEPLGFPDPGGLDTGHTPGLDSGLGDDLTGLDMSEPEMSHAEPSPNTGFEHGFEHNQNQGFKNEATDSGWDMDAPSSKHPLLQQNQPLPPSPPNASSQAKDYRPIDTSDIDTLFAEEKIDPPKLEDFQQSTPPAKEDDEFDIPDFNEAEIERLAPKSEIPIGMQPQSSAKPVSSVFSGTALDLHEDSIVLPKKEPFIGDFFVSTIVYRHVLELLNDYNDNLSQCEVDYLNLIKGIQKQKNTYDDAYLLLDSIQEEFVKIDNTLFGGVKGFRG